MSLINRIREAASLKGFSPSVFIILLVCVVSIILLMLASIAGVGALGAFNHIVGTYHSQTVQSSDAFVISDLERLLKSTSQNVQSQWQESPLTQNTLTQARNNLAAWHWNPVSGELTVIGAAGGTRVGLSEAELPFAAVIEQTTGFVTGEDFSLPVLPKRLNWQITRQTSSEKSAWLMWGIEEGAKTGIWGFRLFQDDLRPELVKLLRRVCHDNHMQVALFESNGTLFIAADYRGELKGISTLTAGKNQEFYAREPGSILSGMTMQVVYTPGIFGQLPDWAAKVMFVLIAILGSLLAGSMVYFYGMERQSTSQLRLQNDWILNLAHSLRGPCHSLGVLLEAMKNTGQKCNEELFLLGHREIETMDAHCRSFLQMARKELGSDRLSLSPISLDECLDIAVARVLLRYPQFDRACIEVASIINGKIIGNRMTAEEVLITLIDNAVKYSIGKKSIKISGSVRDGDFVMQIQDSGAGISSEDISRIGQPFFRSSRPELEGVSGTGVGLYLAREACIAMGWQFKIASEGSDKGTLITLSMPMEQK